MGVRPFKPIAPALVRHMYAECAKVSSQEFLTPVGRAFLEAWVTKTLALPPRPGVYKFLSHRWAEPEGIPTRKPILYDGMSRAPKRVRVELRDARGLPLPMPPEDEHREADEALVAMEWI